MLTVGIAAEAAGDVRIARVLGDRLIAERSARPLAEVRAWVGVGGAWFDVHNAISVARDRGVLRRGKFQGEPGLDRARELHAILAVFADAEENPAVVVVMRDTDGGSLSEAFAQATQEQEWPFVPVLAGPHPEVEAWLLLAWEPRDDAEIAALAGLRKELGYDPTLRQQRLTAGRSTGKHDCKRILAELAAHGESPEDRWAVVDLGRLDDRGVGAGLTAFLFDFRTAVAKIPRP